MKSRLVTPRRQWLIPLGVGVLCVLLGLGEDGLREPLRYERGGLAAGELWRLLTAHLVHLGGSHLAMNLVALGILSALFDACLDAVEWAAVLAAAALGIDAGLYWLTPSVEWYVGLSGVLHGVLVAGAFKLLRRASRLAYALLALVIGKLAWEQLAGPLPLSATGAGGAVIVAAHLFGAIAGPLGLLALNGVRRPSTARL